MHGACGFIYSSMKIHSSGHSSNHLPYLTLTNIAPEKGWLEDDPFLFGAFRPNFRGKLAVSFRECIVQVTCEFSGVVTRVSSWK